MAFFSSVSSSIGKKLLLFGLRHIDILDKDPADFVSVSVGKETTLEVRDVGLHVKKLVSLLHLKLPAGFQLSKARASLLRVTFVLDFGVPQIKINIDGIQVYARLVEHAESVKLYSPSRRGVPPKKAGTPRSPPPSSRRRSTSSPGYDSDDSNTHEDDVQIPTVDDLAKSFLREEPAEEIQILQEALNTQSEYLAESAISSEDGDDLSTEGFGAPLGLPAVLRNLLNTALDRLQISATHIDIQVEDQLPNGYLAAASVDEDAVVSLNFHVERILIDSATPDDVNVDITISKSPAVEATARSLKRRMRLENVFARIISDARNFTSLSRVTRPSSPADTRSDISSSQKGRSEISASEPELYAPSVNCEPALVPSEPSSPGHYSLPSVREEADVSTYPDQPSHDRDHLASSGLTADEDRFADAASEGDLDQSISKESPTQAKQYVSPWGSAENSMMYDDDEGLLEYALNNSDHGSDSHELPHVHTSVPSSYIGRGGNTASSPQGAESSIRYDPTASELFLGAALPQVLSSGSSRQPHRQESLRESISTPSSSSDGGGHQDREGSSRSGINDNESPSPDLEELSQSKLFTHDDAESMYMSAMSAAPSLLSHHPAIPGRWESSSSSSQDTTSNTPAPDKAAIIANSVPLPMQEVDDGCETPRPVSRQSVESTSQSSERLAEAQATGTNPDLSQKLSKLFFSVDTITLWFPLELEEEPSGQAATDVEQANPILAFSPPNLTQDSIFQEMPGSFSNYAHSSSGSRGVSMDTTVHSGRPNTKPTASESSARSKQRNATKMDASVGTMIVHIDISTGRLIFQVLEKLLKGFADAQPGVTQEQPREQASLKNSQASIQVNLKHIRIAWLESLATQSFLDIKAAPKSLEPDPVDAILRLNLDSVCGIQQITTAQTHSKLNIGHFKLLSLDQDVLSFHVPKSRSRHSITKSPEQLENDIEIDLEQASDCRVTIVTRPVKLTFDLPKLDEALGSFGGFSGVLELGNSISSTFSNSPTVNSRPKTRAVHFGDTSPPPTMTASTTPKFSIQFGEVTFMLKGKSCAVQVQTTSIRCVVRQGNLRLKISEVHLSGPYMDSNESGPPLLVDVKVITVNFLFSPEEVDLTKLISMITPSKDPYENDEDILIETLLRQRRKGSVLRVDAQRVGLRISDLDQLQNFEALGLEVARLARVTKYLPDDDRPGILTLTSVQYLDATATVNERLGEIFLACHDTSLAHVGVPALLAVEIGKATLKRQAEVLVHEVIELHLQDKLPMIMARLIGDEMEPIIKAKLFNVCAEYHVSTIMAALGFPDNGTVDDIALGLASSIATITGTSPKILSRQSSESSGPPTTDGRPLQLDVLLRGCAIGLNPRAISSKGLFVLTEAHVVGKQSKHENYSLTLELRKASIHAVDDVACLGNRNELPKPPSASLPFGTRQLLEIREDGFVCLSSISAAKVQVNIVGNGKDQPQIVDVEFKNELFVIESCADSTQTLAAIMTGLQPPMPPSTAQQYRTVVPLQQMMESFTGDAVDAAEGLEGENFMENADFVADEVPNNLEFVGSFYNPDSLPTEEDLGDSMLSEEDLDVLAPAPIVRQRGERGLLQSFQEQYEVTAGEDSFDFNETYFRSSDSEQEGNAHKWDSRKNQYKLANEFKTPDAPLRVRVRDVNIIWNLFDGYDWPRTRGIIEQAVEDVEARAEERRRRPQQEDDDEDFVEADFLFNSVWVGVPVADEKGTLSRAINHDIDDLVSETGSYATSTATRTTGATARPRSATKSNRRKLKLERSKHKKISFELSGVAVDLVVFPPGSDETINSLNVRIQNFEIYDHVPSSTWKKFATSLIDPDRRESNRAMIDIEVQTVKPVTDLAASELVIKVTVQPLRLHVDQDALDFITRFFEFKDDSIPLSSGSSDQPFIQRLEVKAVTLKLDYKPKRVDYRGLRSGHTTEFMNFLILDGSDIVLRHAVVYGITSFDKLHKTLNDVWMPDVKRNQLPGVLSGLAAVRPLVNVGSGVRDLVVVPMREYKKDGRIVRSLQKGVYAFARNTTSEVARLGAKVAIGTQNLLEGAENFLNPQQSSPPSTIHDWDDDFTNVSEEERRAHSKYANQPIGVKAGLRSAARHLERDMLTMRDAVFAIPTEIMEEGTGMGMARVLARQAPTVILRPALGATKAISNTLLGVGNALDKDSRRKIEDKYKSY